MCQTTFRNLKTHMLKYSNVKPYECKPCLKTFALPGNLKNICRHIVVRSLISVNSVTNLLLSLRALKHICWHIVVRSLMFVNSVTNLLLSGSLKNIYWHIVVRSLMSVNSVTNLLLSPQSFTQSWSLKTHILKHSGEKNYECIVYPILHQLWKP